VAKYGKNNLLYGKTQKITIFQIQGGRGQIQIQIQEGVCPPKFEVSNSGWVCPPPALPNDVPA